MEEQNGEESRSIIALSDEFCSTTSPSHSSNTIGSPSSSRATGAVGDQQIVSE